MGILVDRFAVVDVAFKVVGVGSVGTVCGIILLMSGKGDPLFLQFKQAGHSVLEPYCGVSPFEHQGQRVVMGQRAMQTASDMFLGWATGTGKFQKQFYVRQLNDAKIKPVIEAMKSNRSKELCWLMWQGACARTCPLGRPGGVDRLHGEDLCF